MKKKALFYVNVLRKHAKKRDSSQRVAFVWLILLLLVVISLLIGQENQAEVFAIWLYYSLVLAVFLWLSADVRKKIFVYISNRRKIWIDKAHSFGGWDVATRSIATGQFFQAKIKNYIWEEYRTKFFLLSERLLHYLKEKPKKLVMQDILPSWLWETRRNQSNIFLLYMICICLLLLVVWVSTDMMHIQMIQYIMPDMRADSFARMQSGTVRLFGLGIYILFFTVFILLMPESDTENNY